MIAHAAPDCTGHWATDVRRQWIFCRACGAAELYTDELCREALRQNRKAGELDVIEDEEGK